MLTVAFILALSITLEPIISETVISTGVNASIISEGAWYVIESSVKEPAHAVVISHTEFFLSFVHFRLVFSRFLLNFTELVVLSAQKSRQISILFFLFRAFSS